jgi:hypothetical protein
VLSSPERYKRCALRSHRRHRGVVYEAEQLSALDAKQLQCFKNEAQAAVRIDRASAPTFPLDLFVRRPQALACDLHGSPYWRPRLEVQQQLRGQDKPV